MFTSTDDLGVKDAGNIEVILYWELSTLFRKGSLFDKLVNEDKSKYFYTELYLVHYIIKWFYLPLKS